MANNMRKDQVQLNQYQTDCKCAVTALMGNIKHVTRKYALAKLEQRALKRLSEAAFAKDFEVVQREVLLIEFIRNQINFINNEVPDEWDTAEIEVMEKLDDIVDDDEFGGSNSLWRVAGPFEATRCGRKNSNAS